MPPFTLEFGKSISNFLTVDVTDRIKAGGRDEEDLKLIVSELEGMSYSGGFSSLHTALGVWSSAYGPECPSLYSKSDDDRLVFF